MLRSDIYRDDAGLAEGTVACTFRGRGCRSEEEQGNWVQVGLEERSGTEQRAATHTNAD